jgi:transcription initiation factor IIE alpha subunit
MPSNCAEKRAKQNKNWKLKHRYGITLEQYDEMLAEQGGKCYICDKHHTEQKFGLAVDHNHTTGAVRKLLCNRCNGILGELFECEGGRLDRMLSYLEEHRDG